MTDANRKLGQLTRWAEGIPATQAPRGLGGVVRLRHDIKNDPSRQRVVFIKDRHFEKLVEIIEQLIKEPERIKDNHDAKQALSRYQECLKNGGVGNEHLFTLAILLAAQEMQRSLEPKAKKGWLDKVKGWFGNRQPRKLKK